MLESYIFRKIFAKFLLNTNSSTIAGDLVLGWEVL